MTQLGFNVQAETGRLITDRTPVLAIVHDDFADPLAPFAHLNVVVWRLMSPRPGLALKGVADGGLPVGAIVQLFNEFDNADTPWWGPDGWARSFIPEVRAARPDLRIAYGGPPVSDDALGDSDVLAMCDVYIAHVGINADGSHFPLAAQQSLGGKPVIIGEAEVDPDHPEALPALVAGTAGACQDYAAEYGFLWGMSWTEANAVINVNDIDFRAEVAAYNAPKDPKSQAEQAYNAIASGLPFVPGKRYVQANADGTYSTVVTFPLAS